MRKRVVEIVSEERPYGLFVRALATPVEPTKTHHGERAQGGAVVLRAGPFDEVERPVGVIAHFAKRPIADDLP